ncbi:hypothetical protein L0Y47_19155 [Ectopseudomonas composti]
MSSTMLNVGNVIGLAVLVTLANAGPSVLSGAPLHSGLAQGAQLTTFWRRCLG